jgi:galactokinase
LNSALNRKIPQLPLAYFLEPVNAQGRLADAGMTSSEALVKGRLFARAAERLIQAGYSQADLASAVFVPGRIEVLGKHTDYCGGRSLICTVERGLCFLAVPRRDRAINFYAEDLGESAAMSLDPELRPTVGHWSNYPMTIVRRIARNFPGALLGADIALAGDLPRASGLSSSSAMMIGTFLLLGAFNRLDERPEYRSAIRSSEDLAGYLGCCENGQSFGELIGDRGVGTFGGSQDHTAILCCKPGALSVYSFCPVRHERDIALPERWRFVIAASGVVAEKTGDALERYNRVSARARTLVELWNADHQDRVSCLRAAVESSPAAILKLQQLLQAHSKLESDMKLKDRLDQFLAESNQLIPAAAAAIESQDRSALGAIVNTSQRNAEEWLQNQIPETVALQRKLMEFGAFAASAFGAGFGGSVWGLVEHADLDRVITNLSKSGIDYFVTKPSCGVTWIGYSS